MGLYDNENLFQVLFLTFVLGCGCAWATGRAIARTWRPMATVVPAMLLLGLAIRFFHFALFQETLVTPLTYLFESACLIVVGLLAWQHTRAGQMVRQYYWLYEANGPFGWKPRPPDAANPAG